MPRKEKLKDDSLSALIISEALKHPRVASLPFIAVETVVGGLKGGEDMAGFVLTSAGLTLMMSGLFRRAWWSYAYVAGAAGYLAEQPLVPIVAGAAMVVDAIGHVHHTQTGFGEDDHR
jgi:hypothetical protein